MIITLDEILLVRDFIFQLNEEENTIVVVEGKHDSDALKNLGCNQTIVEFHSFGGIVKFTDSIAHYENIILLFDSDRKGKYLTRRVIEHLQHRTKIDLSYKKRLIQITNGRIRNIEDMVQYEQFDLQLMDFIK